MQNDISPYIQDIAEALWNNRACLFVGAGFTRNAENTPGTSEVPLWNDLGDLFYQKIYGKSPDLKDRAYANVMTLAEEVESCFGRRELIEIIKKNIDDMKRKPSQLYSNILSLPWHNIYTTNYDSVLERASSKSKRTDGASYALLYDEKALSSTNPPYIAKLHGDFDHIDNLIITQEDYRTYPAKHKLFISEVRDAFVKNTMVIIGFSGDDPNFLQWIGWIKDNLAEFSRKIYLISASPVSEIRHKTLEKRNITVLDISTISGDTSNYKEKLDFFFRKIYTSGTKIMEPETRFSKKVLLWGKNNEFSCREETDYAKLYDTWKKERMEYPGWVVLPRDKREYILSTDSFILKKDKVEKLESPFDILFLNEFNWRLEKCLYPIENEWEPIYLSSINKLNKESIPSNTEVTEAFFNLKLGLLRLYRQEGFCQKWENLDKSLMSDCKYLTDEQISRWKYEQCLYAIYHCDLSRLKQTLEEWPNDITAQPFEAIKIASLWAEYISLEKGKKIAFEAQEKIAERFKTCSYQEKYYWASRNNIAHTIINLINSANFSIDNERLQAQETWTKLKKYDDIWYEREFFDARLRTVDDVFKTSLRRSLFELGRYNDSYKLNRNSDDYRITYGFFNYYEEIGFPCHLPYLHTIKDDTLNRALSVMTYCSPAIAQSWMLRSANADTISFVFSRKRLNFYNHKEINKLYETYLKYLEDISSTDEPSYYWASAMRQLVPEVLSRLCSKACHDLRTKTWMVIKRIYSSSDATSFKNLEKLVCRLAATFKEDELLDLIPYFTQMPSMDQSSNNKLELEPMVYLMDIPYRKPISIKSEIIDKLISAVDKDSIERRNYISRLVILYQQKCLDNNQIDNFANALWKHTNDVGFPKDTIFSNFFFLELPHPKHIDPSKILKDYFSAHHLKYNDDNSIAIFTDNILINNILGTTNKNIHFVWECNEIKNLINDINLAWDRDKKHTLYKDFGGFKIKERYRARFIEIGKIITSVLAQNKTKISAESSKILKTIINEYPKYHLPNYAMKVAFKEWFIDDFNEQEFYENMSSDDEDTVMDSLRSLLRESNTNKDIKEKIECVTENFRCNNKTAQANIIEVLNDLLYKHYDSFSDKSIQNILYGLKYIFATTEIDKSDDELLVNEKLYLRQKIAPMVSTLCEQDPRINKLEGIQDLKKYYENDDTFIDIKLAFESSRTH